MKKTGRTRIPNAGKRTEVSASEVKNAWHEVVERVSQAQEEIIVTRYGKPVTKLTPVEEPGGSTGNLRVPGRHGDGSR